MLPERIRYHLEQNATRDKKLTHMHAGNEHGWRKEGGGNRKQGVTAGLTARLRKTIRIIRTFTHTHTHLRSSSLSLPSHLHLTVNVQLTHHRVRDELTCEAQENLVVSVAKVKEAQ